MTNETKLEALSKRVQRMREIERIRIGEYIGIACQDDALAKEWQSLDGTLSSRDINEALEELPPLLANLAAEKARADAAEASLRTEEIECDALWEIIGFLREDVVMQELERSEEYWLEAYEGTKPDLDMCAHGRFTKLHDLTTAIKRLNAQEGK